ncbi:hypothetical protein HIM_02593 [Hirsutella minnesotensis 3608]|nr:hypothetical protein HIM_02593 [Hirsutella minnesotensis 3608]
MPALQRAVYVITNSRDSPHVFESKRASVATLLSNRLTRHPQARVPWIMTGASNEDQVAPRKHVRGSKASSSILFQSQDKSVVLLDIPRSLEESQVLPGQEISRRIFSGDPPAAPYQTPEPKDGTGTESAAHGWSSLPPGAAIADLMTVAAVQNALERLSNNYLGPLHIPRLARDVRLENAPVIGAVPIIPPGAEYLSGSIEDKRQIFLDTAPKFDLIVLDPPWPNRSARRKRRNRRTDSYATADTMGDVSELLARIPIASHLSTDGLVAVWITNKPSIRHLLTSASGVFATWGLELAAEWTWLKIAASGEPLFDVNSAWRKPWEKLLIARKRGVRPARTLEPKAVIAIPDVHSRKPNLRSLFQEVLGKEYIGLEVFARNLTAGWWSWGDEVLKFQEAHHWSPGPSSSQESRSVCKVESDQVPERS